MKNLILLFLIFLPSLYAQTAQRITYYSETASNIEYQTHGFSSNFLPLDVVNIQIRSFFEPRRSCSVGHHVFYTQTFFGGSGTYVNGASETCQDHSGTDVVRSHRTIGDPTNIEATTLTVFPQENFVGDPLRFNQDMSSIPATPLGSLILTGVFDGIESAAVTVFTQDNFGGFSTCVQVPIDRIGHEIRDFPTYIEIPFVLRSLSFGCLVKN